MIERIFVGIAILVGAFIACGCIYLVVLSVNHP
jgi:hypothetical protein